MSTNLKGTPVIVRQYLSPLAKVTLFGSFFILVLFLGIVIGIMLGMQPIQVHVHPPTPLEVPESKHPDLGPFPFDPNWMDDPFFDDEDPKLNKQETWTHQDFRAEVECLAQNIYFEAAYEGVRGWIAVANVTINRVKHPHFPNSICGVVWQKAKDRRTGKMVAHFSWTLDGRPDVVTNKAIYQKIYMLSDAMLAGKTLDNFIDLTEGALYYHADYVDPYWNDAYHHVRTIGRHLFYRTKA